MHVNPPQSLRQILSRIRIRHYLPKLTRRLTHIVHRRRNRNVLHLRITTSITLTRLGRLYGLIRYLRYRKLLRAHQIYLTVRNAQLLAQLLILVLKLLNSLLIGLKMPHKSIQARLRSGCWIYFVVYRNVVFHLNEKSGSEIIKTLNLSKI